jgi:short chain dehydrogenase
LPTNPGGVRWSKPNLAAGLLHGPSCSPARWEGIGRATVVRLAQAGHVVFAAGRPVDELETLAAEHPGIRPVVLDVTQAASIDRAREQNRGATAGHRLDVLVNAAGTLVLGPGRPVPTTWSERSLRSTRMGRGWSGGVDPDEAVVPGVAVVAGPYTAVAGQALFQAVAGHRVMLARGGDVLEPVGAPVTHRAQPEEAALPSQNCMPGGSGSRSGARLCHTICRANVGTTPPTTWPRTAEWMPLARPCPALQCRAFRLTTAISTQCPHPLSALAAHHRRHSTCHNG